MICDYTKMLAKNNLKEDAYGFECFTTQTAILFLSSS